MVFFSCEGCNETLKKAQVENHIRRCGCPVSCVDCSTVFPGMTYHQHTSCISEAEKYEKSLYKGPKGGEKKKRDPQAEWMDLIAAAAAEVAGGAAASPLVRNNLQRMSDLGNVPRNEKKFKNFLSNSLRINRPGDQDELWQFLRKRLEATMAAAAAANGGGKENGDGARTAEEQSNKKKEESDQGEEGQPKHSQQQQQSEQADRRGNKRKDGSASAPEAEHKTGGSDEGKKKAKTTVTAAADEAAAAGGGDFAWEKAIKKAVKGSGEGGVGLKSLRKQVVAQVAAAAGADAGGGKKALKKLFKAKIEAVSGVVVRPDKTVVYDKKAK